MRKDLSVDSGTLFVRTRCLILLFAGATGLPLRAEPPVADPNTVLHEATPVAPPGPKSSGAEGPSWRDHLKEGDRTLHFGADNEGTYEKAIAAYRTALKQEGVSPAEEAVLHARIAQALFRIGDVSRRESKKLEAYKAAEAEAAAGFALDPRCADCLFWKTSSLGRWGETRGVMKSLFLLGDLRSGFEKVIELDPHHTDALLALGIMDTMVPGFAGGDMERAEKTLRSVLKRHPRHTRAMIELAVLLEDDGRDAEAIALLEKVLATKDPLHRGDYKKWDRARAQKLLDDWR